jgi:thiol-disulfide isomerase/thioredoxin
MNPPGSGRFRKLCSRLAATVCVGLATATPAFALEPGDAAPNFSVPLLTADGELALSAYAGKVVYLDFWASWCPPCLTSLPQIERLRGEFSADRFQIVAINLDREPAKARRFLSKVKIGYPSGIDSSGVIPERFELETMPTSFLIDGDGVIRHIHEGFRKSDMDVLRERIHALVAAGGR